MPIFYCAGCKFLWLAHWSKGEEVRSENELVVKMLVSVTDRTLDLNAPDAGKLHPVRLTYDDAEAGV